MIELQQTQGHRVALTPSFAKKQGGYEEDFTQAMHQAGIDFRDKVIADGAIHRFFTGKKGHKDGWYVNFGLAGAFGDWSKDIHQKWSLSNNHIAGLDKEEIYEQIDKAKEAVEKEQLQKHEETAQLALIKWQSYSEVGGSPYLIRKNVDAFGIRDHNECVVIPLRDIDGKLWSLQSIGSDGTKRFLPGGKKKGCFHHIGVLENGKPILICEGYATGASIHMATKQATVIAFDAGNIVPVIGELKKAYPKSPLIIAGDDDMGKVSNVGREKSEEAAKTHGCSTVFPVFKNKDTKPTDFNDLHVLEGLTAVKDQLTPVIQSLEWPEPTPLHAIKAELHPVVALPPSLIPEPYRDWLVDIAERMQCPLDYVAVGSIIVTASIIGAGCSIRPKMNDPWTVIPNLWGGIVGAPSTMKSPALKEIIKPLEILENEAFEQYEKDQVNCYVEGEAFKATKEVIKKEMAKAAGDADNISMGAAKERLRNLKEPPEPICKRYSTNDATIEKMHELLSHNERGLLLFRDELMGLLANWDREGHESDRAFYLEAWNGFGSKITDRIGRGTIHTKNLCISLLGSTQPTKLLSYFQKAFAGTENDGLIQRMQLLVFPDEIQGWKLIDRKPHKEAQQKAFQIMKQLTTMNFGTQGAYLEENNEIPYFHFDHESQPIFYEWLTEFEARLRNSPDESIITEHLTKYRKLMPSLALIFHLINLASNKSAGAVTRDCVEQAAGWCEYLEMHARRIYELALDPGYQAARALAKKIQKGELKDQFAARDVYRKHWAFLGTTETTETACDLLVQYGWLREETPSGNRKTKSSYLINPGIMRPSHG